MAADARESIRRDTATLATATDIELQESDPFADVEGDKDELEKNELVLGLQNWLRIGSKV